MRKLSPQRRRATILAALAAILAAAPTLLLDGHVSGVGIHFLRGLCIGIALPLLVASVLCLRRDRHHSPPA